MPKPSPRPHTRPTTTSTIWHDSRRCEPSDRSSSRQGTHLVTEKGRRGQHNNDDDGDYPAPALGLCDIIGHQYGIPHERPAPRYARSQFAAGLTQSTICRWKMVMRATTTLRVERSISEGDRDQTERATHTQTMMMIYHTGWKGR